MALERSYLVAEHVEGLTEEDVHLKSLSSTLRKKYGIWLANSKQKITAVYATDMEAELLRVKKDEPLMRYEGLVYDRRGRLIEFFNNILLLDCAEFRIREFV
jgi:DNA-binding GntR family transcriptional regulator